MWRPPQSCPLLTPLHNVASPQWVAHCTPRDPTDRSKKEFSVDCIQVDALNLLKLAPGGHVGRFCIWTEAAFKKLGKSLIYFNIAQC